MESTWPRLTSRAMRLLAKGLGWVFILVGVFLFEFLVYELWYTNRVTVTAQSEASSELEETFTTTASPEPIPVPNEDGDPPETLQFFPEEWPDGEGMPIANISIPDIDLDWVVFSGVETETLKKGPGAMRDTSFPGQMGNSTMSGHRTTYGSPFHELNGLEVNDEIMVKTKVGTHTYGVRAVYVVEPTDVWVTNDRNGAWLTLTACHPKWSAAERIIVQAEMIDGPNAPYARHLKKTEPPIKRNPDQEPLEVLVGEF